MQELQKLVKDNLFDIFPIDPANVDLRNRNNMSAILKRKINVSYTDNFEIPEQFLQQQVTNWRRKARPAFIQMLGKKLISKVGKKLLNVEQVQDELSKMELDKNNAFADVWLVMIDDIHEKLTVSTILKSHFSQGFKINIGVTYFILFKEEEEGGVRNNESDYCPDDATPPPSLLQLFSGICR